RVDAAAGRRDAACAEAELSDRWQLYAAAQQRRGAHVPQRSGFHGQAALVPDADEFRHHPELQGRAGARRVRVAGRPLVGRRLLHELRRREVLDVRVRQPRRLSDRDRPARPASRVRRRASHGLLVAGAGPWREPRTRFFDQQEVMVMARTPRNAKWAVLPLLTAIGMMLGGIANAHHGYSLNYETDNIGTIEGVVEEVFWSNPHVQYYIAVKREDGSTQTWIVETHNLRI